MEGNIKENADKRESAGSTETVEKIYEKTFEFIVLIRGRNCSKTIEKCLRSIKRQTYPYWRVLISLDAPTDNSEEIVRRLINSDERFYLSVNPKNYGVCHNMYNIIKEADRVFEPRDEDVGAVVDADDYISKEAFKTVENTLRKDADICIAYGSYKKLSKKRRTKISRAYPVRGDIRKLPWRGSHLKVIKWKVLKKVRPQWFRHNGEWLQAASDLALMFNCIDIVGLKRIRHIHKIIYYWNDRVTKRKRALERKCERILRRGKNE